MTMAPSSTLKLAAFSPTFQPSSVLPSNSETQPAACCAGSAAPAIVTSAATERADRYRIGLRVKVKATSLDGLPHAGEELDEVADVARLQDQAERRHRRDRIRSRRDLGLRDLALRRRRPSEQHDLG